MKISLFLLLSLLAHISFAAVNAKDEAIQLAQNLPELTKSFISQLVKFLSDENFDGAKLSESSNEVVHFLTEIKKLYENKGFDFPTLSSARIEQFNQDLSTKQRIIDGLEKELNEKNEGIEQLTQELSAKLGIIEDQERELNEKEVRIALNQGLSTKLGIIENRETELNDRSIWIEHLIQELFAKQGIIESRKMSSMRGMPGLNS